MEKEGEFVFEVPSSEKKCKTWYKIFGDLSGSQFPAILLHGGPGACHEYLLNHKWLTEHYQIPTIFYDQIGNGKSTRLPEKMGDETFWTEELFRKELDNLVDGLGLRERGFDLIGQSWGGMLASSYASYQPRGLRRIVLFSAPAEMKDWIDAQYTLRKNLPQEVQDTLNRCEREGKTESEEYGNAMEIFYAKHLCQVKPWPAPEAQVGFEHLMGDPTVYGTMWGPSEVHVTGTLRNWSITDRLHLVKAPALLINGVDDEAQDSVMLPYFQRLAKVKWITIDNASHFSHLEQKEKYMQHLSAFLLAKDE